MHKFCNLLVIALVLALNVRPVQAQRPDSPQYAKPGPYAVGVMDLAVPNSAANRPLRALVWYPAPQGTTGQIIDYPIWGAGHAVIDAPPDGGGLYPLIVFSHGFGGMRSQSTFLMEHFASHGFVVMAVDHPGTDLERINLFGENTFFSGLVERPADISRQIDFAETLNLPGQPLAGLIDLANVAVSGHSFGGYTALAAGGARLDFSALDAWCDSAESAKLRPDNACVMRLGAPIVAAQLGLATLPRGPLPSLADARIKAVVALAPWNAPIFGHDGLAALKLPTLIMVGSSDRTAIPERDAYAAFDDISSPAKTLVTLEYGGHSLFVDQCPAGEDISAMLFRTCADPVWDMDRAHDLIKHYATAFALAKLRGDKPAEAALRESGFTGVQLR